MYYPYGFFDSTILLMIPAILISLYASFKVKSTTNRYFNVRSQRGMTGADVARRILDSNGLNNVPIYPVRGLLSDHYDPRNRTVSLSENVYYGNSVTSISVAAHECGHAIQHSRAYFPLTFRSAIVPAVHFASSASWFVIMAGFIISPRFLYIGIMLFAATVIFQIITLPVEFNASRRALVQLESLGIVGSDERKECRKVLSAAALTYVAAALASILELVRLIIISRFSSDE